MTTHFASAYLKLVIDSLDADHNDNYDEDRFGPPPKELKSPRQHVVSMLRLFGLAPIRSQKRLLEAAWRFVEPSLGELEWVYQTLQDDESRKTLAEVTAYRALGHRKIKLALNSPEHKQKLAEVHKLADGGHQIDAVGLPWKLTRMNLKSLGYDIELYYRPSGIMTQFVDEQYRCVTDRGVIGCASGDVVIDAGGCWGDTALYFAERSGPTGEVFVFEFLPDNLAIMRKNLSLNTELSSRIEVIENAVWSKSREKLSVRPHGPGTSVSPAQNDPQALMTETLSIDDLIKERDLSRVDFIKMDIEGAELEALKGSEQVIRRFKPKLAITVYHNFKDFWTIPRFIDQLGLGYHFYLRHFKIHAEETVLFAEVR